MSKRTFVVFTLALMILAPLAANAGEPVFLRGFEALQSEPQQMTKFAGSFSELVDTIRSAPNTTVISISGEYHAKGWILKADTIVFDDGAKLVFDDVSAPYWVIVAKELKFSAPNYRGVILRPRGVLAGAGAGGATPQGRPNTPPQAPNKDHGYPGQGGSAGGVGGRGGTQQLPPLFIVANAVSFQPTGDQSSGFLDLRIWLPGIDGGVGGRGGTGGQGGDGGSGGNGVSQMFDCAGGPGDGGNGGDGGPGGQGGPGGSGGNGGDVYYVGSRQALDELEFSRVLNPGGQPGAGGGPGKPGSGGNGGPRGARTGWCNGGSAGGPGGRPSPSDQGYGLDGDVPGDRGVIHSVEYDVSSLF